MLRWPHALAGSALSHLPWRQSDYMIEPATTYVCTSYTYHEFIIQGFIPLYDNGEITKVNTLLIIFFSFLFFFTPLSNVFWLLEWWMKPFFSLPFAFTCSVTEGVFISLFPIPF